MKPKTLKQLVGSARNFMPLINRGKSGVLRVAEEKRALERELRAAGYSRREAARMVWDRFRGRG